MSDEGLRRKGELYRKHLQLLRLGLVLAQLALQHRRLSSCRRGLAQAHLHTATAADLSPATATLQLRPFLLGWKACPGEQRAHGVWLPCTAVLPGKRCCRVDTMQPLNVATCHVASWQHGKVTLWGLHYIRYRCAHVHALAMMSLTTNPARSTPIGCRRNAIHSILPWMHVRTANNPPALS